MHTFWNERTVIQAEEVYCTLADLLRGEQENRREWATEPREELEPREQPTDYADPFQDS